MKVFILPCMSWVEKQQGTSFLVETQLQQWKNKRERKIGFPLLSFFFELLEFLNSKERMRLFVRLREDEEEVFVGVGWREFISVLIILWSVLWGVGVVFIVVFLENIIIISHGILWIWEFLLENYICLVSLSFFFSKVTTCNLRKFHWILDWCLFSLWKEICLKTFPLDSLLIDFDHINIKFWI